MRKMRTYHSKTKTNQLRVDRVVALVYGVKISDIHHNSTARRNAEPRMVSMYIQHEILGISHPRICRYFHKRSKHAISIYAVQTISGLIVTQKKVSDRVKECIELYQNYEVSKVKQRYNLHYRIRQSGIQVSGPNRTVYISWEDYNELEGTLRERINRLAKTHHYSLQLTIC